MIHHGPGGAQFIAPNNNDAENQGAINRAPTTRESLTFNPDTHYRRSIRLRDYDYSQAGAYFITLCTQNRECLFGEVLGDIVRLNDAGCMVQDVWQALPDHYAGVALDAFVVMPNHIRGIVILNDVGARFIAPNHGAHVGAQFIAPNNNDAENQGASVNFTSALADSELPAFGINRAPTIGEIIRAFKARCTYSINQLRGAKGPSIWQRNYYEHIIRNESSLQEIREYITNNPAQWSNDRENPDVVGAQFIAPNNDDGAVNQGAMNRAPTDSKDIKT